MDLETMRDQDDTVDRLTLYADRLRAQGRDDVTDVRHGDGPGYEPGWEHIAVGGDHVHVRPAVGGGYVWLRYRGVASGQRGRERSELVATARTRGRLEVPADWQWRRFDTG